MNLKTTISKILTAMLVALLFLSVPQTTPAAVQPNLENSVQLPASSLDNKGNDVYQVAYVLPDYTACNKDHSNYEGRDTPLFDAFIIAAVIAFLINLVIKIKNKIQDRRKQNNKK